MEQIKKTVGETTSVVCVWCGIEKKSKRSKTCGSIDCKRKQMSISARLRDKETRDTTKKREGKMTVLTEPLCVTYKRDFGSGEPETVIVETRTDLKSRLCIIAHKTESSVSLFLPKSKYHFAHGTQMFSCDKFSWFEVSDIETLQRMSKVLLHVIGHSCTELNGTIRKCGDKSIYVYACASNEGHKLKGCSFTHFRIKFDGFVLNKSEKFDTYKKDSIITDVDKEVDTVNYVYPEGYVPEDMDSVLDMPEDMFDRSDDIFSMLRDFDDCGLLESEEPVEEYVERMDKKWTRELNKMLSDYTTWTHKRALCYLLNGVKMIDKM